MGQASKKKILPIIILSLLCLFIYYGCSNGCDSNDYNREAREALKEYILTDSKYAGRTLFLSITEFSKSAYPDRKNADINYFDWQYYRVSFYLEDEDFGGMKYWTAVMTKEKSDSLWTVKEFGVP